MSSNQNITTNFKDSNGVDLGSKLVRKDYLLSVYPSIGEQIGIPPELWVWGLGGNGRLGNADTTNRSTPVTTFAGGTNWKEISCKNQHKAATKTDGTLWIWGNGPNGRLGDGTTTGARSTPITTFAGGTDWKQVTCGNTHTSAIKTDGTLWVWGNGVNGRLGNGATTGSISTPVTTFSGGSNWKQLSSGSTFMSAIKTDGTLWVWGGGTDGQLGDLNTADRSTPVTTFSGGTNWKQVSCGNDNMIAIKTDGTLWTWGRGTYGTNGNGNISNRNTPVTTFAGGTNWKQVNCGNNHAAAIKTDGTLWTWGRGADGELGNADTTSRSTPVTTFSGGTNWKQVSCGNNFTAAIKTDGTLWTWGSGTNNELGNANLANRSTPITTFAGGTNWKQVNCGGSHVSSIQSVDFVSF